MAYSRLRIWDSRLGSRNKGSVIQYGQDPTVEDNTKRARGLTSIAKGVGRTAEYIFGLAFNSQVHIYNATDLTISNRDYGKNSTKRFMRCMSFYIKLGIRTDGEQLVTGGREGAVHVWDIGNPSQTAAWSEERPVSQLVEGHTGEVGAVDYGHDVVVTCSDNATIKVWPHREPLYK